MAHIIVQHVLDGETWWMEWSTIVDAPVTYPLGREEFVEWFRDEYGRVAAKQLLERMARAERTGTSSTSGTRKEDLIALNRARPCGREVSSWDDLVRAYLEERALRRVLDDAVGPPW